MSCADGKGQANMAEAEDFTPEELALIDKLDTRQPIVYGRRTVEIHGMLFVGGK